MTLDQLLQVASLAKPLAAGGFYRRILPRVVVLAVLSIAAGILFAALILMGLGGLWQTLLHHGWSPREAWWLTFAAGGLVLLALISGICRALRHLGQSVTPSVAGASEVMDAFIDGLREPSRTS
jgi:hypothetical protein